MIGAASYFYFFSYGSNLVLERIKERVPSVEIIEAYQLKGFSLVFNKASIDGSTKANIQKTNDPNDSVWGVIQRIDILEKPSLDKAEGYRMGYDLASFDHPEIDQEVHYYFAHESKYLKEDRPFDWYLDYVIYGAMENGLPEEYLNDLLKTVFTHDDNPTSSPGYDPAATEKIEAHKKRNPEVWQARDNRE